MRIRCDRGEMGERLQGVAGIVSASSAATTKPILQDVLLRAEGGELSAEATDLDISARVRIDRAEVEEDGRVALRGSTLLGLVREIPASVLTLQTSDGDRGATLEAEGFEFRLVGDDPDEFPVVNPFSEEGVFSLSREKLLESLKRVGVAASRESARYQLTGVFFQVEEEKVTLTATDGKRLTTDQLRIENPGGVRVSAIVPNRAVDLLIKVLANGEESVRLSLSETELQVDFGYGSLQAKLIEGTYPEYRGAIPTEKKTRLSVRRSELIAAVRSASLVADRETCTVIFSFETDHVQLETQDRDKGQSRIRVSVDLEGEPVRVRFNPVFLLDALRTVPEEEIRMEFCGGERPGTVRGGSNYRHYLMPLVTG